MLLRWSIAAWDLVKQISRLWREHRSAQMASSLAFFGAVALGGLALVALYAASHVLERGRLAAHTQGSAGHIAGSRNAQILNGILHQAATRHDAWVGLAVGIVTFLFAVSATAFQMQKMLDVVWDQGGAFRDLKRHAGHFAAIYPLSFVLAALLFAGAAVHALTAHTHHLDVLQGVLYQALVIGVTIVALTFVFLFIFAYLPPVDIPWRHVWLASFVCAILYERGQFALSVYFGQMNASSPYADTGALLAVLLWLYYSACVVLIGADFTKVLKERPRDERVHSTG